MFLNLGIQVEAPNGSKIDYPSICFAFQELSTLFNGMHGKLVTETHERKELKGTSKTPPIVKLPCYYLIKYFVA